MVRATEVVSDCDDEATNHERHDNRHAYWTQGRCMMLVGLEVDGPRVERLSAGAKAVYERTGDTCPG